MDARMDSETPLVITGMHRSGTSLLARFIHHSGIDLGDDLLGANRSNPYGHFEDVEILTFHRRILEREFGHQMWAPGPPSLKDRDWTEARTLVAERQHKGHWGWKDPRTSLFLDLWAELLPGAHILVVIRHPDLVIDSLSRRTGTRFYQFWKHDTFARGWLIYNRACLNFCLTNRSRCTLVDLEAILRDPGSFVRLMSERLSVPFDENHFRSLYDESALVHRLEQRPWVSPVLRLQNLALLRELRQHADI
jgi:hypothetical protein